METFEILESFVFHHGEYREIFAALNISSVERKIGTVDRPEFKNILKDFDQPKIISILGLKQLTLLVEPKKINRKFPTLMIDGYNTDRMDMSKTGLLRHMRSFINIVDFIPPPLIRKIIYISQPQESVTFSEYMRGEWTTEDPMEMEPKNSKTCGAAIILENILDDLESFV